MSGSSSSLGAVSGTFGPLHSIASMASCHAPTCVGTLDSSSAISSFFACFFVGDLTAGFFPVPSPAPPAGPSASALGLPPQHANPISAASFAHAVRGGGGGGKRAGAATGDRIRSAIDPSDVSMRFARAEIDCDHARSIARERVARAARRTRRRSAGATRERGRRGGDARPLRDGGSGAPSRAKSNSPRAAVGTPQTAPSRRAASSGRGLASDERKRKRDGRNRKRLSVSEDSRD
eukprot:30947-Pelagococcus_subviridis.AAC.13